MSSIPLLTRNAALYVTNPDPTNRSLRTSLQSAAQNADRALKPLADSVSGSTLVDTSAIREGSGHSSPASHETMARNAAETKIPQPLLPGHQQAHAGSSLGQGWKNFRRTFGAVVHRHERGPGDKTSELFLSAHNDAQRRSRQERRSNRLSREMNDWIAELEWQQQQQQQQQEAQQAGATREKNVLTIPQDVANLPRADSPGLGASTTVGKQQQKRKWPDTPFRRYVESFRTSTARAELTANAISEPQWGDSKSPLARSEVGQRLASRDQSAREKEAARTQGSSWSSTTARATRKQSASSRQTPPPSPAQPGLEATGYFDSLVPLPSSAPRVTSAPSEYSDTIPFPPLDSSRSFPNPPVANSASNQTIARQRHEDTPDASTSNALSTPFSNSLPALSNSHPTINPLSSSNTYPAPNSQPTRDSCPSLDPQVRSYHQQLHEQQNVLFEAAKKAQAEKKTKLITQSVSGIQAYLGAALDAEIGNVADGFRGECLVGLESVRRE